MENMQKNVDSIISEAKRENRKGRYYVYEEYKSRLYDLNLSSKDYERACIDLAKALRV